MSPGPGGVAVSARPAAPPPVEIAACPLCGAWERTPIHALHDAVWGKPGNFGLVRCDGCRLAFLSPRPPREHIGFYYAELYEGDALKFEEALQHGRIAGFLNRRRMAALFARRRPGPGEQHLDVGCGVGGFLLRIVRATGCTGVGVDFDHKAVDAANRRAQEAGLPVQVRRGTLSIQDFAPASFATVSMIHFLEHSYVPAAELAHAFEVLEPGGAIVVEVPGDDSLARRVYGPFWFPHLAPQHVALFSRATLARALSDAGFEDVRVRDVFAPLVWLSSFVLWYHATLGGRSRFAKNIAVRAFTLLFAIVAFVPMLLADLLLAATLPWLGRGDHIRATGAKPASGK